MDAKPFDSLSNTEKIDFFVRCQDLLLKYHPNSPFLFRKDNAKDRLAFVKPVCEQYKGFAYWDDNVCAIYNKIVVNSEDEAVQAVSFYKYKPPAVPYNAIIVDFVVFKELKDCVTLVAQQFNASLKYILFIRHSQVRIYPTLQFLSQGLGIPIV